MYSVSSVVKRFLSAYSVSSVVKRFGQRKSVAKEGFERTTKSIAGKCDAWRAGILCVEGERFAYSLALA